MRSYELVLVLRASLKEGDRKKIIDNLKDLVGKSVSEKEMGQLPLSYPIKKEVSGYFVSINFEAENLPDGMEKNIFTNDGVLRHLLLKTSSLVKTSADKQKLKVKSQKEEEKPKKKLLAKPKVKAKAKVKSKSKK